MVYQIAQSWQPAKNRLEKMENWPITLDSPCLT